MHCNWWSVCTGGKLWDRGGTGRDGGRDSQGSSGTDGDMVGKAGIRRDVLGQIGMSRDKAGWLGIRRDGLG